MLTKQNLNDVNNVDSRTSASKTACLRDESDEDLTAINGGNISIPARLPAQQHSIAVPAQMAKKGPLSAQRAALGSGSSSQRTRAALGSGSSSQRTRVALASGSSSQSRSKFLFSLVVVMRHDDRWIFNWIFLFFFDLSAVIAHDDWQNSETF